VTVIATGSVAVAQDDKIIRLRQRPLAAQSVLINLVNY